MKKFPALVMPRPRSTFKRRQPARAAPPPPPAAPRQPSLMASMAATAAQGFAFGAGSAAAHRAVDGLAPREGGDATPSVASPHRSSASEECTSVVRAFLECKKHTAWPCDELEREALRACLQ